MAQKNDVLFLQRLQRLEQESAADHLPQGQLGLEKECLRINSQGRLSRLAHPIALGSALTNPCITTDFSEALLEFITPPEPDEAESVAWLNAIFQHTCKHLSGERLWALSMPCLLAKDEQIPIADYGSSHLGQMKRLYRKGLALRYGSMMQAIAGVHFNYSVAPPFWPLYQEMEGDQEEAQNFIDRQYFATIRNLLRHNWILLYLFGASPALCSSFLQGKPVPPDLQAIRGGYHAPWGTSLRMGDMGYHNRQGQWLAEQILYNDLAGYSKGLQQAISTPWPAYSKLGVRQEDGQYRQLSDCLLQVENEYYNSVRPKQRSNPGERAVQALQRRGVQYIELRTLDLIPWQQSSVDVQQLRFMVLLTLYSLFSSSPPLAAEERKELRHNHQLMAYQGRCPGLRLRQQGSEQELQQLAAPIFSGTKRLARLLDARSGHPEPHYQQAWHSQQEAFEQPQKLPSARILAEMEQAQESFFEYGMRISEQILQQAQNSAVEPAKSRYLEALSARSLADQKCIEAEDKGSFSDYLANYYR